LRKAGRSRRRGVNLLKRSKNVKVTLKKLAGDYLDEKVITQINNRG